MLCEKVLGKINDFGAGGREIDYVEIDWDDAFKKIHRKTSAAGRDVGIRMDDSVLTRGLVDGDVLYADDSLILAVRTPPSEMIRVQVDAGHRGQVAKVCYEIGNRHAQLFAGEDELTFFTPFNEPMLQMLSSLHGVSAQREVMAPDAEKRISSGAGGHSHGHEHSH